MIIIKKYASKQQQINKNASVDHYFLVTKSNSMIVPSVGSSSITKLKHSLSIFSEISLKGKQQPANQRDGSAPQSGPQPSITHSSSVSVPNASTLTPVAVCWVWKCVTQLRPSEAQRGSVPRSGGRAAWPDVWTLESLTLTSRSAPLPARVF